MVEQFLGPYRRVANPEGVDDLLVETLASE
jgi:hypothetical protein